MIDLRSDTVTLPTSHMRQAMLQAEVGDDAYGGDPSLNKLRDYCKELFNVEDALFTTSGMLANRLAIMTQVPKGDEVITEYNYHINFFDSASCAAVCHVVLNTCFTKNGILTWKNVSDTINSKPRYYYFAQPKLVSIENTINGWVGKIFPMEEIKELRLYTQEKGIKLHLDGARIFNSHVETGITLAEYAQHVDTMSICFSKGLGAPFGSMLMGKKETIEEAKRYRMWLGSGVHQIGFNASAALYALQNHIPRIKEDHEKTKLLKHGLEKIEELKVHPQSAETNMIQFTVDSTQKNTDMFLDECEKNGLLLFPWLPKTIRAVVHQNISMEDISKAIKIIEDVILSSKN
jgi:threonine aldolase